MTGQKIQSTVSWERIEDVPGSHGIRNPRSGRHFHRSWIGRQLRIDPETPPLNGSGCLRKEIGVLEMRPLDGMLARRHQLKFWLRTAPVVLQWLRRTVRHPHMGAEAGCGLQSVNSEISLFTCESQRRCGRGADQSEFSARHLLCQPNTHTVRYSFSHQPLHARPRSP